MTTVATGIAPRDHIDFCKTKSGVMSWVWTLDHKRIGLLYFFGIMLFFIVAMGLGLLIRGELYNANDAVVGVTAQGDEITRGAFLPGTDEAGIETDARNWYNKILTLHGVIMIFLVVIPAVPAVFGNFFLPIMIGAEDVAFPRLNLMSWYCYVVGAVVALLSVGLGGVDTGWTFYAPYSTQTTNVILPLTAAFILGWSSILTGINFIVTIHQLRDKNIKWFEMPLFCWALYASSWIQVLATPVVGITLIMLILEKILGVGIFDPSKGGDPVLYQHMFWIYSHPAVYIMILPPMGVISEIIPTFSRKTIFGYHFIAFSSMAIALIGSLVWAHHMFTSTMADEARVIFSFLTFLVAVPSAVKVFNWLSTMYKGSVSLEPPMIFALIFIILFSIGGFSGLVNGSLSTDVHIHDTAFVVGHFHYVMFGGGLVAFFAGLLYWFPKMFGRMYNNTVIYWCAALFFFGFNTLYGTMKWLGIQGMPRRYADYVEEFQSLNRMATMGSWFMVGGLLIMFGHLFWAMRKGRTAPDNPWGGATLEWTTKTPPPLLNFEGPVEVKRGAYEYPEEVEK